MDFQVNILIVTDFTHQRIIRQMSENQCCAQRAASSSPVDKYSGEAKDKERLSSLWERHFIPSRFQQERAGFGEASSRVWLGKKTFPKIIPEKNKTKSKAWRVWWNGTFSLYYFQRIHVYKIKNVSILLHVKKCINCALLAKKHKQNEDNNIKRTVIEVIQQSTRGQSVVTSVPSVSSTQ